MNQKCLIIEDELPAQRILKKYIADVPYLELKGLYKSPVEALEYLQSENVDVLFLDINLPKISGLNFLRSLQDPPAIIVTTAYPDYAQEGYELNVIDYLLKPFSFERFLKAISKIRSLQNSGQDRPGRTSATGLMAPRYVFVKVDKVLQKVDFDDIRFIESDRDYVKIVMSGETILQIQTLKYWEELLPDGEFARIHKSFIVNISKVEKIVGNQVEIGSRMLPVGRHYKQDFLDKIETIS